MPLGLHRFPDLRTLLECLSLQVNAAYKYVPIFGPCNKLTSLDLAVSLNCGKDNLQQQVLPPLLPYLPPPFLREEFQCLQFLPMASTQTKDTPCVQLYKFIFPDAPFMVYKLII